MRSTLGDRVDQARQVGARLASELFAVQQIGGLPCLLTYMGGLAAAAPDVIKKRSLGPADARMRGQTWAFSAEGQRILLDGGTIGLVREIYGRRCYFSAPGFELRPDDVVIDLGAQVGVFTVLAAKIAKRVIAVEAQHGFTEEMEANLRANGCLDKVSIEHGLIGGSHGKLSDRNEIVAASHFHGKEPPAVSMEDLVRRHDLTAIQFMKVDIEGSEFEVFKEGAAWLPRVERIAMEVHCNFGSTKDLAGLLERNGFETWLFDARSEPVESLSESSGFLFARRKALPRPV